MNLYELTGIYLQLMEMASDPDVDPEVLEGTLEAIDGGIEEKAEGYAKVINTMKSEIDAIDSEIKRLQSMKSVRNNSIDRMKTNLFNSMKATNKTKFKSGMFSFSIQKNGGAVPVIITDGANIPEEFLIKQDPVPDKKKIGEFLKSNTAEWAVLGERGESLRIK